MFKTTIKILLLIYIGLIIYYSLNLQKYNVNGFIIETNNDETIINNINKLNPILFNSNNVKYQYYHTHKNYIFKDKSIVDQLNIQNDFDINKLYNPHYHFPVQRSITIIKNNNIEIQKCIHNYNIITILEGECIIYLFNPKHSNDIKNKGNDRIKKWGHKKYIKKGDTIIIPPYWYYIQETCGEVIQSHIDIDTYFTFIPNFLKDFYLKYTYGPSHSLL